MAKYEIEIDDSLIPEGCVPTRLKHARWGTENPELKKQTQSSCWTLEFKTTTDPKEWWPKWLTCDWVVKGKSGTWYAGNGKTPTANASNWNCLFSAPQLDQMVATDNFPDVAWEESLFKNPWK